MLTPSFVATDTAFLMVWPFLPLFLSALIIWANTGHQEAAFGALFAVVLSGLGRKRQMSSTKSPGYSYLILISTGLAHFAVLFSAVALLPDAEMGRPATFTAIAATGLYLGQVSNSAAHELIHAANKPRFWLGASIYASLLFGHHASAHRLVHHVHVGTIADPNSATRGTSLYRFLPNAWLGSYRAGLAKEKALRRCSFWRSPYPAYMGMSTVFLALSYLAAGLHGIALHLGLAIYATLQLLTTDYVQHYGLRRDRAGQGKTEPVGQWHSWDAPGFLAGWMTFNAPAHGAHHIRPSTPYTELRYGPPQMSLPYSLAVMGFIAFVPRWYRRVMKAPLAAVSESQS